MIKIGISLTYKVLIAFLLILIPMFVAIFVVFSHTRGELEKEIFGSLQRYADEREGYVLLYLEMSRNRVLDFSTDDFIIRSLDQLKDRSMAGRLLSDYMRTHKLPLLKRMYRLSVITGTDGRVLASTAPGLQGRDFSREEFFIKGRKSVYITELTKGIFGTPEVAISAPIYSRVEKGRVIGVLTGFVELSQFAKFFTGEYLRDIGALSWTSKYQWETMEIYLVNRDRLMITESRFVPDAVLRQRVDTEPVKACLEKVREFTGIYRDYRGVEVVGASMCIPVMGWTLISEVDRDELLHGVKELQLYTAVLTAVIVLFTGALVFYFMRIIATDLRRLVEGARMVSAGEYDVVIPVRRKDEIGVLSGAFNDMALSIKTRTAELENERELLANAQRVAHLGSWEWDLRKDIVYWSQESYRIFGVSRQEFGATFEKYLDLIHPDDRNMVRDKVSDALYRGKDYRLEHRIIRKDGGERILFCEGGVSFDREGRPDAMSGIVQDITERSIAERALEESEMRYRTLIETLQEGVLVIDENNIFVYLNPKMAEMLGYTVQEMMDRPLFDFMDDAEIERARARLERRKRGVKELVDAEFLRKDGARLYATLAAAPIMEGGEYRGAIAGVIDVTERRRAEEALRESEERLRAILDGMDNPVFMNDLEGRMLFINNALSSGFGRKKEELLGKTVFDIFPPDAAGRLHKNDLIAIESDTPTRFEEEVPLPDGIHYGLITRFVLKDKNGKKYAFCGVVTDITSLKRTEEELRKSEASLRDAQRIAHIGNWEWDIPNNYVHRSDEVFRIYGKPKEEFTTAEDLINVIHPEDKEFVRKSVDEALKGIPYSLDTRIIRDGEERYVHIEGELIRDEAGNPARMVGTVQDISDRKRAEEEVLKLSRELEKRVEERTAELKKAMEGLAAANREIETFTYSVAHDLRSPLRLIDGFSILLLKKHKDRLDPDGQDQLSRIRGAARRMNQLIDDLLNLSYVMRAEVSYGIVNLSGLAWAMMGDLQKAAPERKVRVRIEEGLAVRGDEGLLRMVMENLIGNAWKFTSKTEEAEIQVGASGGEYGRTVIYIRDNGVGFDMRYAERLFQPFQRLHQAQEFPGTGIGLATVQRIIQRHGGRIWAESEPGRGAAFYFTLERKE